MKKFWILVEVLVTTIALLAIVYSGMDRGFLQPQVWFPLVVIIAGASFHIFRSTRSEYTNDRVAILSAKHGLLKALIYGLIAGVVVAGLMYFWLR